MEKGSCLAENPSNELDEEDPSPLFSLGSQRGNEECGICTEAVSTRGVLDCCSHVFCFACIHSWSAITNLCPLCKSQFKFITFLPGTDAEDTFDAETQQTFFDFLENEREDGDEYSGDEDAVFAFPSCFIDEDAVVCLDGDGCKIRAGHITEDKLKNDTSVACDSCDCWYHSVCVGYDPSNISQRTWQCPRCVGTGALGLSHSSCSLQDKISASQKIPFGSKEHQSENEIATASGPAFEATETCLKQVSTLPADQPICTKFNNESLENAESCILANVHASFEFCPTLEVYPIKVASSDVNGILDLAAENKDATSDIQLPTFESASQDPTLETVVDSHYSKNVGLGSLSDLTEAGKGAASDKDVASDIQELTAVNASPNPSFQQAGGLQKSKEADVESISNLIELVKGPLPIIEHGNGQVIVENLMVREREVRTRKIVHRRNESDGHATFIVEAVRKQLKQAVGSGASKDLGQVEITDNRFLEAFKAAMVKSVKHDIKKSMQMSLERKKISGNFLRKKGSRANITKKLYGGSGKRRKSWDRDWDVAFWKERAVQTKKARTEAIQSTPGTEKEEMYSHFKEDREEPDPIFSRLYLADTSLLPRQDKIQQGLKDSEDSETLESSKRCTNDERPISKSSTECFTKAASNMGSCRSSQKSGPDAQAKKVEDMNSQGKKDHEDVTSQFDKRKWALEVLSRKTGETSSSLTGGSFSKKKHSSLLDQLPTNMRPVLEYDRRSRVPTAIRQVQLNRFIEHFLQKANVKTVERTPECESIIAAAVCREREIYEKSNSKGVYSNLCVQALSHSNHQTNEVKTNQLSTFVSHDSTSLDIDMNEVVIEALKATGLISDSPPGSPVMKEKNTGCLETNMSIGLDLESSDPVLKDCTHSESESQAFSSKVSKIHVSQNAPTDVEVKKSICTSVDDVLNPAPVLVDQGVCSSELQGDEREDTELQQICRDQETSLAAEESSAGASSAVINNDSAVQQLTTDGEATREKCISDCIAAKKIEKGVSNVNSRSTIEQTIAECTMMNELPVNAAFICAHRISISLEAESNHPEKVSSLEQLQQNSVCVSLEAPIGVDNDKYLVGCSENNTQRNKVPKGKEENFQPVDANQIAWKQLEKYIKEHLRPLQKSGVITTEQYQWAVAKTTNKVMQYHPDAKTADFVISEGDKVKKLSEQYLKLFKQKKHV